MKIVRDCGHSGESAKSYGVDMQGKTHCPTCSYARELVDMQSSDRYIGYMDSKKRQITTFLGQPLLINVSFWTIRHNLWYCRTLTAISGEDANGNRWYGKGSGDGMSVRIHRSKSTRNR